MTAENLRLLSEAQRNPLPNPHITLPDWAWAEWVEQQGIGE